MERLGLVSQLEGELERVISLGQLPRDGLLPSEQTLAQKYGVSRTTAREALLRLSARGLVVQHPGRRARAVALDEAVTLENLGMGLHGEGSTHPERRRLLEGYLALKREATVELLAACCEQASELERSRVAAACFALEDSARWENQRPRWAALEFELLRQAATAACRPGHLLLLQSLERAFRGISGRVVPYLDSLPLHRWAQCARQALEQREAQVLRTRLPALLEACDERVLAARPPSCEAWGMLEALYEVSAHEPELRATSEAQSPPTQAPEVSKAAEPQIPPRLASEVMGADEIHRSAAPATVASDSAAPLATGKQQAEVSTSAPGLAEAGRPGSLCANRSGCPTGSGEVLPGGAPSAPDFAAFRSAPSNTALEGESLPRCQRGLAPPEPCVPPSEEPRQPSQAASAPAQALLALGQEERLDALGAPEPCGPA